MDSNAFEELESQYILGLAHVGPRTAMGYLHDGRKEKSSSFLDLLVSSTEHKEASLKPVRE